MKTVVISAIWLAVLINFAPRYTSLNPALISQENKNEHKENQNIANLPTAQNIKKSNGTTKHDGNKTTEVKQTHVIIDNMPQKNSWQEISAITNIGLALIAALTLGAIWYQARETARAAKAASDTAEATKNSVTHLINKERARIGIQIGDLVLNSDGRNTCVVYCGVIPTCPTPALNISSRVEIYLDESVSQDEKIIPPIKSFASLEIPHRLVDNEPIERTLIVDGICSMTDESKLRAGTHVVRIRGIIEYKDFAELHHRTKFGYFWMHNKIKEGLPTPFGGRWFIDWREGENEET